MTNRLTPVGSGLGAEARWGLEVVVQIVGEFRGNDTEFPQPQTPSSNPSSAIFFFHSIGALVWTFSPPESTATVTGKSRTSNSITVMELRSQFT
jgi:hypothetical protein